MFSLLLHISKLQWAITRDALETLCEIAQRKNDLHALTEPAGKPTVQKKDSSQYGATAVISVRGPLFRYANLLTQVSGATSYEMLGKELKLAAADSSVKEIVLAIDSPGGEVNGCIEFADLVAKVAQVKPVHAFIGGLGASAAYWIASAATTIKASPTALIGSIGVQSVIPRRDSNDLVFVSSTSPHKNLDPATDEGAAACQRICDDLADVFVWSVANNRGVTPEHVGAHYGKGAVFVASKAKELGMIDDITTFEDLISMTTKPKEGSAEAMLTKEFLAKNHPDLYDEILMEGRLLEQRRLAAIEDVALPGHESLVATLKEDLSVSPEKAALLILKAQKEKGSTYLRAMEEAETELTGLTSHSEEERSPESLLASDLDRAAKLGVI